MITNIRTEEPPRTRRESKYVEIAQAVQDAAGEWVAFDVPVENVTKTVNGIRVHMKRQGQPVTTRIRRDGDTGTVYVKLK